MGLIYTLRTYGYYYKKFGKSGINFLYKTRNGTTGDLIEMRIKGISHPIYLRNQTSDIPTFDQVFLRKDYEIRDLPVTNPKVIIDCGANIGLAAIFFANKYPQTMVYSIEPELSNFEMLKKNTANYANIVAIHAAVGNRDGKIKVIDPGLGNWAFTTQYIEGENSIPTHDFTEAVSIYSLLEKYQIKNIDLLKIDIEGAEKELFQDNYEKWLPLTKVLIVELHDNIKEGTSKSFFNAMSSYDYALSISGENLVCEIK